MGHGVVDMAHSIKDGFPMRNVLATLRVDLIARDVIQSWGDTKPPADVVRLISNFRIVSRIWEVMIYFSLHIVFSLLGRITNV